jgi:hypothetical protein
VDSKVRETEPSGSWYASGEFNFQLSGVYALTQDTYHLDRYLHSDHAWGGSIDAKYFLNRYLAVGLEEYALSATRTHHFVAMFGPFTTYPTYRDERIIGAGLATLTIRASIGTSRFAPFGFAGVGAITGAGHQLQIEYVGSASPGRNPYRASFSEGRTEALAQFGGGLEMRLSRHFGVITDFSWNVIDGRDNNFGMARTGVNFAF